MLRKRISTVILTGVICVFAVFDAPVRSQEEESKEAGTEVVQPPPSVDPTKAITTSDPDIPIDELGLLVKPLTLGELQTEAGAWLILVKNKVQEISKVEIAIKRENIAIQKQEEAVKALEEAKVALTEAEEAKVGATPGSPEYEEAAKKVEVAKEKLKKAQEALEEAATTKKSLKEDEEFSSALEKGKETGEIETAKQVLDEAEKARDKLDAGSLEYEEVTKKIDTLDGAIAAFEKAKEAQKGALPDSPEYKQATGELEKAGEALKKARSTGEEILEIDKAKQVLEEAKKERDKLDAGSVEHKEASKKIDALDGAIAATEKAKETQKAAKPDSEAYKQATGELQKAREALKKARLAIEDPSTTETNQSKESSQNIEGALAIVENTEINLENQTEVAGDPKVDSKGKLEKKGDQLEETTEQLEDKIEAESELKKQLVITVTELQSQQIGLIDRFEVILDELDSKGGDSNAYRKYIEAISGVEIDLQDTEGLGVRLISWVSSEEGGLRWAFKIATFVSVFVMWAIISQIIGFLLDRSLLKVGKTSNLLRHFLVMVVRRGGLVLGAFLALSAIEVSLGPVLALLGGVSFVLAFALQSNIGNLASGLMLMVNKPFDIGDEIQVGGIWGWIDSITLANTKIKGFKGQMITLPNNSVWGEQITNLTASDTRKGVIYINIPLITPIAKVQEILVDLGKSHPLTLDNPAPSTFVWKFGEYFVQISFGFTTKTDDFWKVWSDIHVMIQERFQQESITIALPTGLELDGYPATSVEIQPKLAKKSSHNLVKATAKENGSENN